MTGAPPADFPRVLDTPIASHQLDALHDSSVLNAAQEDALLSTVAAPCTADTDCCYGLDLPSTGVSHVAGSAVACSA
eukprot:SAG22_NODE_18320_length_289_cov_0.810526_1_plen_76_part_01